MKIETLWFWNGDDAPELIEAWDEYRIDDNPEGFADAFKQGREHYDPKDGTYRHITIKVSDHRIAAAFDAPEVNGEVSP